MVYVFTWIKDRIYLTINLIILNVLLLAHLSCALFDDIQRLLSTAKLIERHFSPTWSPAWFR